MYDPIIYDRRQPVQSYWEATAARQADEFSPLMGAEKCDVAIIGGGYTGLSAALFLTRNYQAKVRLLEAGPIGWGASGRNGGFCCLPASKLSVPQLIKRYGLDETKRFFAAQLDGMEVVRELITSEKIPAEICGDGNFEVAHHPKAFPGLAQEAEALTRHFGIPTEVFGPKDFRDIGHGGAEQFGALLMKVGFALHPLKFALGLARAAARHGARLHSHSAVVNWHKPNNKGHLLRTENAQLQADHVIIATNGYTQENLHKSMENRVLPVLSNIIVTEPIEESLLAAVNFQTRNPLCNSRNLLFYYRLLPDNRFLMGARGDTTGSLADGQKMRDWMTRRLGEIFPAWRRVPVAYFWRGLTCMTLKYTPSVGQDEKDPTLWYGYGYHANGVNTAPWTGRLLAQLIGGNARPKDEIPTVMAGPPPFLPFARLRPWYLRGALAYYRVKDHLAS